MNVVADADSNKQGFSRNRSMHTLDHIFKYVACICGILILLILAAVAIFLLFRATPLIFADRNQLSSVYADFTGGKSHNFLSYVIPLIFGTVLMSALALCFAFFVAIGIALFISHYAPKKIVPFLSSVVDLLAAIPSVIYGLWGGLVLVPAMYPFWDWISRFLSWIPLFAGPVANPSRCAATVSVVLAVMILPIITSIARDIFQQAPRLQQEGALALGATKWEMIKLAVLPFAKSGIVSASMLGLGRALGETMAVLMILSPGFTFGINIFKASQNQTIAANIAAQYPEANGLGVSALIGTGLVLFVISFVVNFVARKIAGNTSANRLNIFAKFKKFVKSIKSKKPNQVSSFVSSVSSDLVSSSSTSPVIDFDKFSPTRSSIALRKRKDFLMHVLIFLSFIVAIIPLASLLLTTIIHGIKRFNIDFLTHNMTYVVGGNATGTGGYGGILHAIIGTLEITLGAMVISIPIGLMCAVYLIEYANGRRIARIINLMVDVMSGIPSIVAGLFAFSMFAILLGPGTINGFEGSVALSILMIPTVVKSAQEMLKIVPNDLREASLALGVTKQRTITKVVLRTALPGIVSGCILAVARVIGETAPLLMASGFIASTNFNLFEGQMTTLPVYVYQEYSKLSANCPANAPDSCVTTIPMERAWSAALALIVIVLLLNIIGRVVARVFSVKAK